jgi:hypothetical protein
VHALIYTYRQVGRVASVICHRDGTRKGIENDDCREKYGVIARGSDQPTKRVWYRYRTDTGSRADGTVGLDEFRWYNGEYTWHGIMAKGWRGYDVHTTPVHTNVDSVKFNKYMYLFTGNPLLRSNCSVKISPIPSFLTPHFYVHYTYFKYVQYTVKGLFWGGKEMWYSPEYLKMNLSSVWSSASGPNSSSLSGVKRSRPTPWGVATHPLHAGCPVSIYMFAHLSGACVYGYCTVWL